MNITAQHFRLAPMSPVISMLTLLLLTLPVVFIAIAIFVNPVLAVPALCLMALYAWVWLRFRPTQFIIYPDRLEVRWPLKRRSIARGDIAAARCMDKRALQELIGRGVRIGAGGLWGGFGWLWTQRRGIVQMYVSRTDDFVWIECANARPWLMTPEQPEAFAQALSR